MSTMGLLTLSFSSPISLPSYLLQEASNHKRLLNVFFSSGTFTINDNLGVQPVRGFSGNDVQTTAYVAPVKPVPPN